MLTTNQLIRYTYPQNGVDKKCLDETYNMMAGIDIHNEYLDILRNISRNWESDMGWDKWLVDEKGKYVGTWTKRFSKFLHEEYNKDIDSGLLSKVGEIVSRYAQKSIKDYFFEINPSCDWEAGNFMERENSCWWGSYNKSRLGLHESDYGYSVRFFDDEDQYNRHKGNAGIGRCWMIDMGDNQYTLFNAYGVDLMTIARVVSGHFGLTYRKTRAYAENSWINGHQLNNGDGEGGGGSTGLAVWISDEAHLVQNDKIVRLPNFVLTSYECNHCGEGTDNSSRLCDHCIENYYFHCTECNGFYSTEDHFNSDDEICDACFENVHHCAGCEKIIRQRDSSYTVWHTNRQYCRECYIEGLVCKCNTCQRTVDKFTRMNLGGHNLVVCRNCTNKIKEIE